MPKEEQIILVDANDAPVGTMGKLETHEKGFLHRAFSIIVKNDKGEILLQKRAVGKYHSGGLWTNTCCGHPRAGEEILSAAHRRLREEMGFDCELAEVAAFIYEADLDRGLKENEFLHVFVGAYNGDPAPNPNEADDWKRMTGDDLKSDVAKNPDSYTYWFRVILGKQELNNVIYKLEHV